MKTFYLVRVEDDVDSYLIEADSETEARETFIAHMVEVNYLGLGFDPDEVEINVKAFKPMGTKIHLLPSV